MKITEIHFDSIDSTNSYAKREYASFLPNRITCVTAEMQTAGRGRHQKRWLSPKGVNLYTTFCFRLPLPIANLICLALLGAYSISSLLQQKGLHPKIKWPNDVRIRGKKVAGVLCETVFEEKEVHIFVGIGVNVNMEKNDIDQIDQPATSLKIETGEPWDRPELMKHLQLRFASDLDCFKIQGFAPFHKAVEQILEYRGETIRCVDEKKEWKGVCHSLSKEGYLNLLLPNGTLHPLRSGTIKF